MMLSSFEKGRDTPKQGVIPAGFEVSLVNGFGMLNKQWVWTPQPIVVLHPNDATLQRAGHDFVAQDRAASLGFFGPINSVKKLHRN